MKQPATDQSDEPEAPAVIGSDHIQDRVLSTRAGAKLGWSKLTVCDKEWRLGHLACKARLDAPETAHDEQGRALARWEAAKALEQGWALCAASWPSGSDFNRVKGYAVPGSFVDHQRDAKDFWRKVEANMGVNDWLICRKTCGEGYKVSETILAIQPGYRDSTLARFREALDGLIIGMAKARKS